MEYLWTFATDPRVRTLAGLILLDIILGIASAIKRGEFEWAKVGEFYQTMVLPMLVGFAAVYFVTPWLVSDLLGEYSGVLGGALVSIAWLVLVAQLAVSLLGHFKEVFGRVE